MSKLDDTEFPMVSCITTTYRKFQYLYETLESIFIQNYPNIELIIGDDGSENFPTGEIVQYIEKNKKDNIVKVIILHQEKNMGTVENCRRCRAASSGTYIMGIASDDRFADPDVISDVVTFFKKTKAEIVTCKRRFLNSKTGKTMALMPFPNQIKWIGTLDNKKIFEKMCSLGFISGCCTYYRRDLYESVGGYDQGYRYIEDYPFFLKLLRQNKTIHFYDRVSIFYRFGEGISTSSNSKNKFRMQMYEDRIRYMEQEILPYVDDMPWWRKEQMWVREKRFLLEKESGENKLQIYSKLFTYSPVGTMVQIYYQMSYQIKLRWMIKI